MTLKQKILRAVYSLGRKVFPSFYYPYKFLGGRIYLDITESLAVLSRARGFYEWPKQKLIYEFMPEGGVMIDIGANKGDFALIAAKKAGANGTVVAIEPDPLNSMLIRKSIEKNNYNYMKLLTCGVSSFNGILQFFIGKESSHNSMVQMEKNQRSIEIITRTLDSIVDDLNLDRVDLIKIDVEGADVEVLTSALNTLEKYRPTLFIDVHPDHGVNPKDIDDILNKFDYTIYKEEYPLNLQNSIDEIGENYSVVAIKN